jgi:hypothetical protein
MSILCIFSICKNEFYNDYYSAYKIQENICKQKGYDCILLENNIKGINNVWIERFCTLLSINDNLLDKYDYYVILDIDIILNINCTEYKKKVLKLKNYLNENKNYNIKDKFVLSYFSIIDLKNNEGSYIRFCHICFSQKYFKFFIKQLKNELKNKSDIMISLDRANKYYEFIDRIAKWSCEDEKLMAYHLIKYKTLNIFSFDTNNIFKSCFLNISDKTFTEDFNKIPPVTDIIHIAFLEISKNKEKYYTYDFNKLLNKRKNKRKNFFKKM